MKAAARSLARILDAHRQDEERMRARGQRLEAEGVVGPQEDEKALEQLLGAIEAFDDHGHVEESQDKPGRSRSPGTRPKGKGLRWDDESQEFEYFF
jgi:hypothetical protein